MSWKKNVFSYFIWLVYTLITGVALVCVIGGVAGGMETGLAGAAAVLLVAGILVFLLYRFAPKYSYCHNEKNTVKGVAEAAIAVVLLAVGLILRIRGLDGAGQVNAYYEMAEVASGRVIPRIVHGAVYFYVQILHTVFYFLGNKFTAGIGLQIILQYGAALMLYYTMRHLAGHIAALITLAFVMCSPYMVNSALILSPEMFYLLFFMAALTWVAAEHMVRFQPSEFLFLGIVISVVTFMDVAGLLLFAFVIAVVCDARKENLNWDRKMSAMVLCFFGLVVGFAACVFLDAGISGKSASGVFFAWLSLYCPEGFRLPVTLSDAGSAPEWVLLPGVMALGIFSFWCDKKRERMGVYTVGVCIVLVASFFGVFTDEMPGNLWLFLLFTMLAGISVEECFRELPKALAGQGRQEERRPVEQVKSQVKQEGKNELAETQRKVNYIENPLPLPRKHEKRVLDYAFDTKKNEDDFDIVIDENDDFDI
ncbi:MAG: hypothetical protein ACI4AB_01805 [Acetatifactor sp.]